MTLPHRLPGAQLLAPGRLHQWHFNGDHPDDDAAPGREGRVVRLYRHPDVPGSHACPKCHLTVHMHGWIDSDGDGRAVCPGDFILTTADGQYVPIPADAVTALVKELTQ